MQKSLMNKTHRLSLPQQERSQKGALLRQKQESSLFSYKKIRKQTSLLEGLGQVQNKRVNLPNISFNLLKQKLSQFLKPSNSDYQQQTKYRYQQESNIAPNKTEKYKTKIFRVYKKNKMLAQFNQTHQEITELGKDFNTKQMQIKNRLSINKQPTFHNIAVKRDCLRYFGQNVCFQKALQFRKRTPTSNKNKIAMKRCQKQKNEKQYIQASLQYSVQDVQKMKVQPWRQQRDEFQEKDFSQIEDLQ